jgi:PAS domain S-box-containing protein
MSMLHLNARLSEQLTTIMETVPAGILSFEYKDGMNFSHCNAQAAKMFGYTFGEFTKVLRGDLFNFIHKDDQEEFANLMHKIENEEIPSFDYIFRHMCKDGSSKLIQGKGRLIARSNGTKYMNVVITEVPPEEKNTRTLVRK